jgi:hypothetical protein
MFTPRCGIFIKYHFDQIIAFIYNHIIMFPVMQNSPGIAIYKLGKHEC